jgi:hypothetical protein
MAQPVSISKALTASNAANICASQTPGAAGAMTLTATPVALDTQRRVLVTCAGNNAAITFTVSGTKDSGAAITEIVPGSNTSTTQSVNDFRTITSVVISAASTGAVTVGTSTVGSTDWRNLNYREPAFHADINCVLTGAATFSLELTNSDYLTPGTTVNAQPTTVVGAAASTSLAVAAPARAWRLTILTGTGTVAADAIQSGY